MTQTYKWLPKPPTPKMIEAGMFQMPEADNTVVEAIYDAMWQAAPDVEQEPVAICTVQPLLISDVQRRFKIKWKNNNPIEGALYTHPQPKREPLSDYEVLLAVGSVKIQPLTDDFILEVARAIEKAHGIGVEK